MADVILTPQGTEGSEGTEGEGQVTAPTGKEGEGEGTTGKEGEGLEGLEGSEEGTRQAAAEGEEGAKTPTPEEQLATRDSEIKELRQLLREGKRSMDALQGRVDSSDAALDKAGMISDDDKKAAADQQKVVENRERELDTILEMTRLNPGFADVDTVVSQANFDDMIEAMAKDYAVQSGVGVREATAEVEGWVWSKVNPYRYMYEQIKLHHPAYAKGAANAAAGQGPVNAPSSIQGMDGGAGSNLVGWTAAKIDTMPEDEINKVPRDVYAKYLRNELK